MSYGEHAYTAKESKLCCGDSSSKELIKSKESTKIGNSMPRLRLPYQYVDGVVPSLPPSITTTLPLQ